MRFFPNGIIPACAGSTKRFSSTEMPFRDHPRMCGEHLILVSIRSSVPGSSPHVRGAQLFGGKQVGGTGIIPACAGSTLSGCRLSRYSRDHPRMCGEHFSGHDKESCKWGSSPHVRGAPRPRLRRANVLGIIPACAGSTGTYSRTMRQYRDHPRMCGEHPSTMSMTRKQPGSSPHVRGAPRDEAHSLIESGIIPACAGSTRDNLRGFTCRRDHPRMCGEHCESESRYSSTAGSSPHVRGARW